MTLMPVLKIQRNTTAEVKFTLVFKVSLRTARTTQRKPVSKNQKTKKLGMEHPGDRTGRLEFEPSLFYVPGQPDLYRETLSQKQNQIKDDIRFGIHVCVRV